jgi:hypothetical protein
MRLTSKYLSVTLAATFAPSSVSTQLSAQLPDAPKPQSLVIADSKPSYPTSSQNESGGISGTVIDLNGDIVPGAIVTLDGPLSSDHCKIEANDDADLHSNNYRIDILLCASNLLWGGS